MTRLHAFTLVEMLAATVIFALIMVALATTARLLAGWGSGIAERSLQSRSRRSAILMVRSDLAGIGSGRASFDPDQQTLTLSTNHAWPTPIPGISDVQWSFSGTAMERKIQSTGTKPTSLKSTDVGAAVHVRVVHEKILWVAFKDGVDERDWDWHPLGRIRP